MFRMKASVDYGLRVVFYLACKDKPVSSRELSEKMAIPRDYMIQLAVQLRKAGIVKSVAGRTGGYKLAHSPAKISALQIVEAFDDHQHARHDIKRKRDPQAEENQIRHMHEGVIASLCSFLDSITVEDLMELRATPENMEDIIADALEVEAEKLHKQAAKRAEKARQ